MSKSIHLLYFASLGEALNCSEEALTLEQQICVAELKTVLGQRGASWANALAKPGIKCAINQAIANDDAVISPGDEVAFFPPVTGG